MEITKDMTIGDIIMLYPEAIDVLMGMGLGCIGCPASQVETLEESAMVHGLDLDMMLQELNR
ncbi:hybrid cluster protein-associated redox disulfide domain-containing protein [Clostridium amylolyticum]|uniref:Hybrid cluster protein-associated redox disulfide domain-containing protein n=1 Tax=Clostridium amylolyticum TaxID=1121298 RepID=A0A1M6FPP2_9CLOT|nr:DUF1858 domain-containing protein [Clostridium amylolyticum]SHI99634.1 hybrid cluster protein-associated redox disulfide domain-containing protein [Clostridium amylolyticum]